jgi:two-component system, NarL family, sensor histidine kinase UhpB
MARMSLRARLCLLVGMCLMLSLAANIGFMIWMAAPRVTVESDAVERFAKATAVAALENLQITQDPEADLRRLVEGLQALHHIRVRLSAGSTDIADTGLTESGPEGVPGWFVRLFRPDLRTTTLPVIVGNRKLGSIVIASNPSDEVAEIWTEAQSIAAVSLATGTVLGFLILLVIRLALDPISEIVQAIGKLEEGETELALKLRGPPEIVRICRGINSLAATLGKFNDENHFLIQKIMNMQEDERKQIAGDLHDKLAPHLFSIRTSVSALRERLEDDESLRRLVLSIDDPAKTVQRLLSRLFEQLQPTCLVELGLSDALSELTEMWRSDGSDLRISLVAEDRFRFLDEKIGLAAYRIVQEGLKNACQHSQATKISIELDRLELGDSRHALRVRVKDDGVGIPHCPRRGFGLISMRERAAAYGGRLKVIGNLGEGTLVEAVLPTDVAEAHLRHQGQRDMQATAA